MGIIDDFLKTVTNLTPLKEGVQKKVFTGIHKDYGKVILKYGNFQSNTSLERIKREINFLKANISKYYPKNYDFLVDSISNTFLIIEEFIDSISFIELQKQIKDEVVAIKVFVSIIKALNLIWEKSIVHRDLKPDNILFKKDLSPIIIDLGIARFLKEDSLTNTLAYMGPCTPIFASPEQLLNKKNIIDQRTDFFALGILLSIIAFDKHPFDPSLIGNSNSIPENILAGIHIDFKLIAKASSELSFLLNKLLEKEPFMRFRDYSQIIKYINENWRII